MAKKTIKVVTEDKIINNYNSTLGGGVLDARQVNPNVSGSYASYVNNLYNKIKEHYDLLDFGIDENKQIVQITTHGNETRFAFIVYWSNQTATGLLLYPSMIKGTYCPDTSKSTWIEKTIMTW